MQGTLEGSLHLFFHIWFKMCRGIASLGLVRTAKRSLGKA